MQNLVPTIREAEHIFLAKVDELAAFQQQIRLLRTPVKETTIREWLAKVQHDPNGRHRRLRRLATAYYHRQMVRYNPLYLEKSANDHASLLDTVLHELGHLFTWHFFGTTGHEYTWQSVGRIVGYAPVGSSPDRRRKQYASYAAHQGQVAVADSMLGGLGAIQPRNQSSISSPVAVVWSICRRYPFWSRRDILEECINRGVNPNTAATQYAKWKREEGWS